MPQQSHQGSGKTPMTARKFTVIQVKDQFLLAAAVFANDLEGRKWLEQRGFARSPDVGDYRLWLAADEAKAEAKNLQAGGFTLGDLDEVQRVAGTRILP